MTGPSPVPSLPPPRPKSPPAYPDLYGKRRELLKKQMLERDVLYLEEELKFVGGLQPASLGCKEVVEFVAANSDPLIPIGQRRRRRRRRRGCRFLKLLRGVICLDMCWICDCRKPAGCLSLLSKCDCWSCRWRWQYCCDCCHCNNCLVASCPDCNWCSSHEVGCTSLVPSLKWTPTSSCPCPCPCTCTDWCCKRRCCFYLPKSPKLNCNCCWEGCCKKEKCCWNPFSCCFWC